MLHSIKAIQGCTVAAADDEIGRIDNFYFDDESWTIRYGVVDTSKWLFGRRVLIMPEALAAPDYDARTMPCSLTKDQIKSSPEIDTDLPVRRQREIELFGHYGLSPYWMMAPDVMSPQLVETAQAAADEKLEDADPNLRSANEVIGYRIDATDGHIGHVTDLLIAIEDWHIRFAVVDTGDWLPGKQVLIAPGWAERISWSDRELVVSVSQEKVEAAPEYVPDRMIEQADEKLLFAHYGMMPPF